MIHPDSILKYQEIFPEDDCGYFMPSPVVMIDSHGDGRSFVSPHDEDDAAFLDRIKRSGQAGKNLFYEEWEEWFPEEGVCY